MHHFFAEPYTDILSFHQNCLNKRARLHQDLLLSHQKTSDENKRLKAELQREGMANFTELIIACYLCFA